MRGPITADEAFGGVPSVDSETFKSEIVKRYADEAESVGIRACIGEAVDQVWPAPGYRAHQRNAVIDILHALYVENNGVVKLSAPTGAGKSLILYAAMATMANEFGGRSFFTTPLNALIDQVDTDEFVADEIITLKGKNNYSCVHPHDAGASVNNAICQRASDFDCEYKDVHHEKGGCPYYGRKYAALHHPEVVTNLSYLMANSMIPDGVDSKFEPRNIVTIDECQSIEDFALQFISVTVSDNAVPVVWDRIETPPRTEDPEELAEWLKQEVLPPVHEELDRLELVPELTEQQNEQQEELERFNRKCNNLIQDVRDNHWVANREVEDENDWSVEFKPIFIGRFLNRFLWDQGNKVILSSATIPGSLIEEVGLDDRSVAEVAVPSTFPTERRPVYTDAAVGKMTMSERNRTIPRMAEKIGDIADHHWEQEQFRGFVHCRSYKIAERIYRHLPRDVQQRTRVQDADEREASLDAWLDAPVDERGYMEDEGGQVFLSVAMDEGISLDDWRARWQVVAKAAYPYMGPEAKRANYRLDELNDWNWYAGKAAINLQQAVGRGMRSKDDWCHSYILDTSATQLIERNEHLFEDWFLNAVDETPDEGIPERA